MKQNPLSVFFAVLICLCFLLGYKSGSAAETSNRVVAVVSDDVITLHELHKRVEEVTGMNPEAIRRQSSSRYEELAEKVLDSLINERIAQEKTKELGINVSETEIDEAIKRIRKDNRWSEEELQEAIENRNISWEEYRRKIKEELKRQKLIDYEVKSRIIIREEDIEEYYRKNKEEFKHEGGIEVAVIFLGKKNSSESKEALRKRAEELIDKINNGADFGELARRYSDGPGAEEGGYLGRFDPKELDPLIREAVESTPEGEVGDLIEGPNGFQIVKVVSNRDKGILPLEEVRDAIYNILFRKEIDRRYASWIEELRENTYTKVFLDK
ncbi:MAG: SurA N-terminal domain-containing protein [Desulfobacteraceae bacterium]